MEGDVLLSRTAETGFGPDDIFTFAIFGSSLATPSTLGSTFTREDASTPPDGARIRFFNASPVAGTVDIWEVSSEAPVLIGERIVFGTGTSDASISAGDYCYGLDTDGDEDFEQVFSLGTLEEGHQAVYWISDDGRDVRLYGLSLDGVTESLVPTGE